MNPTHEITIDDLGLDAKLRRALRSLLTSDEIKVEAVYREPKGEEDLPGSWEPMDWSMDLRPDLNTQEIEFAHEIVSDGLLDGWGANEDAPSEPDEDDIRDAVIIEQDQDERLAKEREVQNGV